MKILIVGLVKNAQLLRIKEEAEKKGHELTGSYSADLVTRASSEGFEVFTGGKALKEFDVIYLWAVSKRRWEWYTAVQWLHKTFKTPIVNRKIVNKKFDLNLSTTPVVDYLKQVEYNLPFPKTAIVHTSKTVETIIDDFEFPLIVKTSQGSGGRGVYKVESEEELITKVKEIKKTAPAVVVREFIPNDGDIRVFTVGYKTIGAMLRKPPPGDFRANISQGGSGEVFDLDNRPDIKEIAEKASAAVQVDVAGVDIILHKITGNPYILEVNPGPQFTGLEKFTGVNAAGKIVEFLEELYNSSRNELDSPR